MDTLNKARTIYKLIEILNDIRDNDYCDHKKNNFKEYLACNNDGNNNGKIKKLIDVVDGYQNLTNDILSYERMPSIIYEYYDRSLGGLYRKL